MRSYGTFCWCVDMRIFPTDALIGEYFLLMRWYVSWICWRIHMGLSDDALIGEYFLLTHWYEDFFYWRVDRRVFSIDALICELNLLTRWQRTFHWCSVIWNFLLRRWNESRFCWRADMRVFSVDTLITYRQIFLSEARFDMLQYNLGIAKKIFCNKNL